MQTGDHKGRNYNGGRTFPRSIPYIRMKMPVEIAVFRDLNGHLLDREANPELPPAAEHDYPNGFSNLASISETLFSFSVIPSFNGLS